MPVIFVVKNPPEQKRILEILLGNANINNRYFIIATIVRIHHANHQIFDDDTKRNVINLAENSEGFCLKDAVDQYLRS